MRRGLIVVVVFAFGLVVLAAYGIGAYGYFNPPGFSRG